MLNLLTSLNAQYPGKVYLMAHGYGVIAAGEALRLAGTNYAVNTYIAMQGAVASRAYDAAAPFRVVDTNLDDRTPDRYRNYYTGGAPPYFSGVGGAVTYVNYFNTNDNVLTNSWRVDEDTKPAFTLGYGYNWDGTNFYSSIFPSELLVFPADTYEIFSYCVEARSEAIGAQPNLRGPFSIAGQLNLFTLPVAGGNGVYFDHSGQFKAFSYDTWAFWDALLKSMRLKP